MGKTSIFYRNNYITPLQGCAFEHTLFKIMKTFHISFIYYHVAFAPVSSCPRI